MVVGGRELIDTLWNVNLTLSKFLTFSMRINRYIMECKSALFAINSTRFKELIDTLWNVNIAAGVCVYIILRINRYIMECKFVKDEKTRGIIEN